MVAISESVAHARLRFGEFELDAVSGELTRGGDPLQLQEQSLRLLIALVMAPGELVTRERLCDELWPRGVHVDFEHGLNTAVRRLREALGDTAGTPRFIETLPRRGYRFVAPVESLASSRTTRTAVAVLPFLNLTPDVENAYLADGITEDLLTELSRVRELKVVSRTSAMHFRNSDRSIREIARDLRVDVVIEGSVRRAGSRVRIAARVIDGRTDQQLWANSYERDLTDIFAIQRSVAQHVAAALAPDLSTEDRERVGRPATTDVEAYQLYLQGRHCMYRFTDEGLEGSIEYFERAAACDPCYARPYAGIAFATMVLGMGHGAGRLPQEQAYPRARAAIDRALAIDPALAEAHGVDACLKFMFEFDWSGAKEAFQRAVAFGPDSAEILDTYGLYFSAIGEYDEALASQRKAHDLDPLAPVLMSDIASTLLRAGRYDEALDQAAALLRIEPHFPMAHSTMGWAYIKKGRYDEGLKELGEAVRVSPDNTMFLAQLGEGHAIAGNEAKAREILHRLVEMSAKRYVSPYHLAYIYAGLREDERAIDHLERAVDERAGGVYSVGGSFLFENLRAHPRFVALLRKMNLA